MLKLKKSKTQKGITLIALIITIVVLLILAAVAISSITNDGILSYAQNAAKDYNQAVKNEQEMLQKYEDYLAGKRYKAYDVGAEVKIGSESFYVIEASDESKEKVLLLAKQCIDTDDLVQISSGYTVAFSTESYWGSGTSPYDIVEPATIPESHIAAKAAYDYGEKLGGTGRLMTYSEASALASSNSTMIYGDITNGYPYYWLGSAYDAYSVCYVFGDYGGIYGNGYSYGSYGVRPVIEISKSKLS